MQALLVSFYCQKFHIFGYLLDLPDRLFTLHDVSCRLQLFDLISAPLRFMYACHLTMLVCVIIYYSDAAHLASIKEAFRCPTISHVFFDDSTPVVAVADTGVGVSWPLVSNCWSVFHIGDHKKIVVYKIVYVDILLIYGSGCFSTYPEKDADAFQCVILKRKN